MKKQLLTITAAAAMAFAATPASAIFFTDIAQFARNSSNPPITTGNVIQILGVTGSGLTYTNNISNNTPGAGGTIRVVGSNIISISDGYDLLSGPNSSSTFNGDALVGVFALEGTVPALGAGSSSQTATFTSGRLAFFTTDIFFDALGAPATNYNFYDPLTWGATDALGTSLLAPIAVFDLATPDFVTPGTGATNYNLLPSQVNKSDLNVTTSTNTQGNFLFLPENPGPINGVTPVPGTEWMTVTDPTAPGGIEGLVTNTNQALILGTNDQITDGSAGFSALNTIAGVLGGYADLGGANTAFATSISYQTPGSVVAPGSTATDYIVSTGIVDGLVNSGDIRADLGTKSAPGTSITIPEPTTLALLGFGLVGMGFGARRRKS